MTDHCESLHAYVDEELDSDDHLAFETHLASCDACNAELPRLLALLTALDTVAEAAEAASGVLPGGARLTLITGGLDPDKQLDAAPEAASAASAAPSNAPPDAPVISRPARRRPWRIAAGATGAAGALAVAAGLLLYFRQPPAPVVVSLQGELGPTRSIEARLSYPGTERYRQLDVARGAQSSEAISMNRMLELEHAKDWHGLAVASLLAGDRERAARSFSQAGSSPQVDSDRAALDLVAGSPAALERALEEVDRALAARPNDAAALWNRALVLAGLNLPLAAARELDQVTALGEPGWADEARMRAQALRASVVERRTRWTQANDAGQRLLDDGTAVPSELTGVTGYLTIILYDAVRAAPSRSRVEALLPLAQALDSAYRSDRLATYVRRIATSDFRIRKPLADTYRELATHGIDSTAQDAFLHRLDQAAAQAQAQSDDIKLGALVYTGRVAAHLDEYRRLAAATGDPWFAVIAEHEAAKAEIGRGEHAAAERRLRNALALAQRERLGYRAILLESSLVSLHRKTRSLSQAHDEAQAFYREATAAGEGVMEMNALLVLAAINQDRYANGLARAYLTEIRERSNRSAASGPSPLDEAHDCSSLEYAHESLANISLLLLDPVRARAELSGDRPCAQGPTVLGVLVRSELFRFEHHDEDARLARDGLAALRAAPAIPSAQQAMLSHLEGDLLIDVDRTAGERSLRDAIAEADHQTDDLNYSVKARAYSFSLLALAAGRASEFAGVIELLAETLEVRKPERCAVAIAVQGQRSVVAFSDAHGATGGQYVATRKASDVDVTTLVPPSIVERLRACARVTVLSRAPVLGAGRLLPPDLAWSYLLEGDRSSPPSVTAPVATGQHRVVIANPEPPPELKLPALGPYPDEPGSADLVMLRGPDATPTRVLLAMRDASVIEFHTHGFIANDVSEASYLVLSPELDGQYAMTARDVAQTKLEGAPLVILGACHAATSSRTLEGGMGLAEAFLRSGARAVVASPDAVQDLGAHAFFEAVRDRVMHGTDPAVAVRDERLRRLAVSHDDTWVSGVVVFE